MEKLAKIFTNTWILLSICIICASLFRLPYLHFAEFKGDEALNLFLATRPLFHHPFPPASQASSAGILNFPLLNYLLFPIVLFTLYPPTISFVIAVLNVFTIGGFFLLFQKYYGKVIAFFASLLLAFSPWAILYSRKIWAQDFLLPLSFPFFLSVYKIIEGKKKYWFLFGASSMLLLQLHQLGILLPLAMLIGLLSTKHKPSWKLLLCGTLCGLIPTISYFSYAFSTHFSIFHPSSSLIDRFSLRSIATFLRPFQIMSLGDFYTEMGNDYALFATQFHLIYNLSKLNYLIYILLPIGTIFFWIKNKAYRFFVPVVFSITLLYFLIGVEPLMHYFILLLPLLAPFVTCSIYSFKKYISFSLLITFLISLILFDYGFLRMLSKKGGFAGDYGSGFATSELSAKIDLQKYSNLSNYEELKLYYFAPMEYFHGYMPVGHMIFPFQNLKKYEPVLEKQFIKTPTNPMLKMEVFAYYTQSQNPSWDYVVSLKEKARQHAAFNFIYQKVLDEYLSSHLKHLYETPDFLLLYPQHWSTRTIPDGIDLTDGSVAVDIVKETTPTASSHLLRAHYYSFTLVENNNSVQVEKYAKQSYAEIQNSIRVLK